MKDRSIMAMAERLLQREITQAEMDRLSAAPTIMDAQRICDDILTRESRLSTADDSDDYERARRMMLTLPKDDINLIIDVIEGRRVEAFVKGFLSGGYEIRPVGGATEQTYPPDTYRSQGSLKMAFLQDMLDAEYVGMIEIETAFEQAKEEYRKVTEED
jgi:hypothetical protein